MVAAVAVVETTPPSLQIPLWFSPHSPPAYFDGNYSASYSLSGEFSNGENITATLNTQSGNTTTFNSQSVSTIDESVSLTNTTTNAVSSTYTENYYSPDVSNLTLVGNYRTIDGVTSVATSTSVFPLTARINEFGIIGTYSLSDGSSTSVTWSLADGFNGKAKLIMTTTVRDSSNALYATSIISWTIAQDGTREALQVTVTYHQSGNLTANFSGNKI